MPGISPKRLATPMKRARFFFARCQQRFNVKGHAHEPVQLNRQTADKNVVDYRVG